MERIKTIEIVNLALTLAIVLFLYFGKTLARRTNECLERSEACLADIRKELVKLNKGFGLNSRLELKKEE